MDWKRPRIAPFVLVFLLGSLTLVALPNVAGQDSPVDFFELGTDAAMDDDESAGSVDDPTGTTGGNQIPSPGSDASDIDDLLKVDIGSTETELVFRLTVAQRPSDSDALLGRFCWTGAFQVAGDEAEYLAIACEDYDGTGGSTQFLGASSSRGTNVISSFEWDATAPVLNLHAALSGFGASVGSILTDIYALTYMSKSLSVDDAAPDAKTDRDAAESFGNYVVGVDHAPGEHPFVWLYRDVDATDLDLELEFDDAEWYQTVINWTAKGPNVRIGFEASEPADKWTISVFDADKGTFLFDVGPVDPSATFGVAENYGTSGALNITISTRKWEGSIHLTATSFEREDTNQPPPSRTAPTSTSGANPDAPAGNGTAGPTPEDQGSPGFASVPALAALLIATAVMLRRD